MIFPPVSQPWSSVLNWESRPGRTLFQLAEALDAESAWIIDIFGSAPLEMAFGSEFVSADVDTIFPFVEFSAIEMTLARIGFARGQRAHYVQPCPPAAFRTSPKWKDRVFSTAAPGFTHVTFRFAHPIDIVLGKLNRLDEKDWRAIRSLREVTNGPDEVVLLRELQDAPDLFSFAFMAPLGRSYRENVELLWTGLFNHEIDVESEILAPARRKLRQAYDEKI